MSVQIDFRWRYQPRNQMDVRLIKYIQECYTASKSEMILLAVRSFWLPYALAKDSKADKQMQRVARDCVLFLKKQAQEILELANLEDDSLSVGILRPSNTKSITAMSSTSSVDDLRSDVGNNAYDDTGLSHFL